MGLTSCGANITSVAFTDILVLLSDSWDGMSRNLAVLEKFCNMTGLKINPKKCQGFLLGRNGTNYSLNGCPPSL